MVRGAFSSPRPLRGSSDDFFSSGGVEPKRLHYNISSDDDQRRLNVKKSKTISTYDSDDYAVYDGRPPSPPRKKSKYEVQQESYGISFRRSTNHAGRAFEYRDERDTGKACGDRPQLSSRVRYNSVDSRRGSVDLHNTQRVSILQRKAMPQNSSSESEGGDSVRSSDVATDETDSDDEAPKLLSSSRRLAETAFPAASASKVYIDVSSSEEDSPSRQYGTLSKHMCSNSFAGAKIATKPADGRRVAGAKVSTQKKKASTSVLSATNGTILFRADGSDLENDNHLENDNLRASPPTRFPHQRAGTDSVVAKGIVQIDSDSEGLPPPRPPTAKRPAQQKSKTAGVVPKSAPQHVRRRSCKSLTQGDITIRPKAYHYLRKNEWESSGSDDEVEDCRLCGKIDSDVKLECDDCLGGFHLICLDPPLTEVPEGDWFCPFCEKRRRGEAVEQESVRRNRHRTARERLLDGELSAVQILKIWKGSDNRAWVQCRRFIIPEETVQGRKPENGRRELFRTNIIEDIEAKRVHRECYIYVPEEFPTYQSCEGSDDCFVCGHHYDEQCHTFSRISDADERRPCQAVARGESDDSLSCTFSDCGSFEEADQSESEDDSRRQKTSRKFPHSSKRSATPKLGGAKACERQKSSRGGSKTGKFSLRNVQVQARVGKSILRKSQGAVKCANKQIVPYGGTTDISLKRETTRMSGTEFEEARTALQLSSASACFPCRDKERAEITKFLTDAVAAGDKCLGRSLYISGVPGTGKTAVVQDVIESMLKKAQIGKLPKFSFVSINALELQSPEHIFGLLHLQLTGQTERNRNALELLNKRFTQARSGNEAIPCVVLVDELDTLVNRNQTELYNLFHWPSLANSRLVVIGIANTMDLPERMLPRIASRMGQRISFAPYTYTQLQEIITARLGGLQVFDKQALEFASRKVSASTGDARKALELCRRAVEFAEKRLATAEATAQISEPGVQGRAKYVGMVDVDAAINKMFQTPNVQMMKSCAKHAKIFLAAMVYEGSKSALADITFEKVAEAVRLICQSNGEDCPDTDTLMTIGSRLGACRLLIAEPSAKHRLQKLQLNCSRHDVSIALVDDKEMFWLKKFIAENQERRSLD